MKSAKGKQWRDAFTKTRSLSQASREGSSGSPVQSWHRQSSILDEQTTDKDVEEYLEGLKKKSGIKSLWHGEKFKKAVRDSSTPDISISSVDSDRQVEELLMDKDDDNDDDDFKPNVMAFSQSEDDGGKSDSSVSPFRGIQLDLGGFSDQESEEILNNVHEVKSLSEKKSIPSIHNNLTQEGDVDTDDEVTEDIYEEVDEVEEAVATEKSDSDKSRTSSRHSKHKSSKKQTISEASSSKASSISTEKSKTKSRSSKSSKNTNSEQSTSSSSTLTESSKRKRRRKHCVTHEMSVQTDPSPVLPGGTGVGVAAHGPQYGGYHLDPTPIATHAVSADAIEAMTAYNPAVIALTDMLHQQLRLVEQFVNNSKRIYQSYSESLPSTYNYTTLQDTLQYIEKNKPKTISMEQALKEAQEESYR